jgi:hypothetical protein
MSRNLFSCLSVLMFLILTVSCSRSPQQPEPGSSSSEAAKATPPAQVTMVYDASKDDITAIPDITSRSISVLGVKLGDRTRDVDRLLGKPIKMEALPKLYRSAYEDHGVYVDIDRYAAKVVALYINTNYYRKAKGNLSELLAHGSIDLLKKSFGENPVQSQPDSQTTMWAYPQKGIQFIYIKAEQTASYTLKLVEPKKS